AHLQHLAEVGEGVDAVRRVRGAEPVDRIQHLAPRGQRALENEIGRDPVESLADGPAVEDLEAEHALEDRRAVLVEHAYGKRRIEEAEPAEALLGGAHLLAERLEEGE